VNATTTPAALWARLADLEAALAAAATPADILAALQAEALSTTFAFRGTYLWQRFLPNAARAKRRQDLMQAMFPTTPDHVLVSQVLTLEYHCYNNAPTFDHYRASISGHMAAAANFARLRTVVADALAENDEDTALTSDPILC
jgi:hypothetical protein